MLAYVIFTSFVFLINVFIMDMELRHRVIFSNHPAFQR